MKPKAGNLPSVDEIIAQLGPPTPESTVYRRERESVYATYPDPDTFYISVCLRPQPRIVWTANTRSVIQWTPGSIPELRSRIHPYYAAFHWHFGQMAYLTCAALGEAFFNPNSFYAIYIPLQRDDGRYFWMRQLSLISEIDAAGYIVTLFNMYRLLEPFGNLRPSRPMIVIDGTIRHDLERRVSQQTELAMLTAFEQQLKAPHRTTFQAYRAQFERSSDRPPTSQAVAAELGHRVSSIRTYNKHILEAARQTFPAAEFKSVGEFLSFLHTVFGSGNQGARSSV
jgi:hypothetical protein